MIYDLYWGERILTSVWAPTGLTDQQVIQRALASHAIAPRVGLDDYEVPYEREWKLRHSEVRAR